MKDTKNIEQARYIDANLILHNINGMLDYCGNNPDVTAKTALLAMIDCVISKRTADVVEVKRGYWKPSPDGINPIRCSECNMPAPLVAGENGFGDFEICRYPSGYCHECGAKMDGKPPKGE